MEIEDESTPLERHFAKCGYLNFSIQMKDQNVSGKWEKAIIEDKEVIVTGDVNINSLKWMKGNLPATDSIYRLRPFNRSAF